MKVSIITAALNNANTVEHCIQSVNSQSYADVEQIIVDGGSGDGTLDIARKVGGRITKVISEPDNGIYEALNKGISLASGDIIGVLSADDFFAHKEVVKQYGLKGKDLEQIINHLQDRMSEVERILNMT